MKEALSAALAAILPDLINAAVFVAGASVVYIATLLRRYLRVKIDDARIALVRGVLANGVRAGLEAGFKDQALIDHALAYAAQGLPGTLRTMGRKDALRDPLLRSLAAAMAHKVQKGRK